MFKHTQDEELFDGVLRAYVGEFGAENVTVYIPRQMSDVVDLERYKSLGEIRVWHKAYFGIRVAGNEANYDFYPAA